MKKSIQDRFWEKVAVIDDDDSCWNWTASTNGSGYGQLWVKEKGRAIVASRVSFWMAFGYWPESALHTCDNPPCVRPKHLFDGSQLDNVRDSIGKGRGGYKPPHLSGERNGRSKITDLQRMEIGQKYERYSRGRQRRNLKSLAAEYGISISQTWTIVQQQKKGATV